MSFQRCRNCQQPIEHVLAAVPYWRHRRQDPMGAVYCHPGRPVGSGEKPDVEPGGAYAAQTARP